MKLVVDRTDTPADENQPYQQVSYDVIARKVYRSSLLYPHSERNLLHSRRLLERLLGSLDSGQCPLPDDPRRLVQWMQDSTTATAGRYRAYLQGRQNGQPREYFQTKGHALYFLRRVALTKLVDGAWLYGTVKHWRQSRYWPLIHTYLEELGGGRADQNHVHLYKQLLLAEGCDGDLDDLEDKYYLQGAVQLALGYHVKRFLPEVIGYNLGYEQLPLHLLITAYELKELGIDPYYFTLHVTVDNADNGHARRAVQAVHENLPLEEGSRHEFYKRVMRGYLLNDVGVGSLDVIAEFDHYDEVVNILKKKSRLALLHSDYKKINGRTVNEWLADPEQIPEFLDALRERGWIRLDQDPVDSPFWDLLQGPRACMKGVFSPYELRIIYEWIAGSWVGRCGRIRSSGSGEGLPLDSRERDSSERGSSERSNDIPELGDMERWLAMMAPGKHDAPEGLRATRQFYNFFINRDVLS